MPTDSDPRTLAGLTADPHNRRKRTTRNLDMIAASLRSVGAARSIVIDETNEILAGNGLVEAAAQAGISKLQIVDVEGDTVVAVRRRGLTDDQKRDLAIYDNRTAELAEWDVTQLRADVNAGLDLEPFFFEDELADLGVAVPAFSPASEGEQGRLDQKAPVTCPNCGHEFTR